MTDTATPVIVNPNALPDIAATAVRYLAALLSGWLIRKGIIADADSALILGLMLALATTAWGLYRTWANKAKLVTVASAAPNHVAIVTGQTPSGAA
jgi:hypothetical protein